MTDETPKYAVIVHDEDGSYWAEVKELPGCFAAGGTPKELGEVVAEAIGLYLSSEPTYTAAEVKVLTETAGEAGRRIGWKAAGEAIADAMDSYPGDGQISTSLAALLARSIASQAAQATSDATSGVPEHQEVSEAARTPQKPAKLVCRRCNGYGLLGVAAGVNPVPCPDCTLPAREPS